jgi:transcriptional regulator with XRE-family HTH domain
VPTLREVRIRRLLSQRELARRAGVAQRAIVEVEAGRRVPRLATMRKLAEALGVDPMEVDEFRAAVEAAVESKEAA